VSIHRPLKVLVIGPGPEEGGCVVGKGLGGGVGPELVGGAEVGAALAAGDAVTDRVLFPSLTYPLEEAPATGAMQ
jgi:hypothetical protein